MKLFPLMYSIRPIDDEKVWDAFVATCTPSTFLHNYAWGEFEKAFGRNIYRFGVYEADGKLVAVALGVIITARRGKHLLCPHGPVFSNLSDEVFKDVLQTIANEYIRIAKEEACVFVRISTSIVASAPKIQAFKTLGFRNAPIHVHTELSWILDITPTEDNLLRDMKKNTRYGIRKAERDGIEIVSSADPKDLEVFWDIYHRTAEYHSFVPYSKLFIERQFNEFIKADSVRWYFAKYKGEVISAAMIIFTPWSAFYHHGASAHAYTSLTPSELLQWQVIKDAKARGCTTYNFWGVVPESKINHPWAGLSRFKKGFGGYEEIYIQAQDYILSPKYWMTYIIERIRRWKRNL